MQMFAREMVLLLLLIVFACVTSATALNDDHDDYHITISKPGDDKDIDDILKEYERKLLKRRENFTKCDEFLEHTSPLDLQRILDIDWQDFYVWLEKKDIPEKALSLKIRPAELTVVKRYESLLSKDLKHVNWSAAAMQLETNDNFSGLLIATNKSGLYHIVTSKDLDMKEENYQQDCAEDGEISVALKFIEPHYLGLLNCKYLEMVALAPADKLPNKAEAEAAAKMFKFRSDFGISSIEVQKMTKANRRRGPYVGPDDREIPSYGDAHFDDNSIL